MGGTILLAFLTLHISVISAQLVGAPQPIQNLSAPQVVAAANAAVQYINAQNPANASKLILVNITGGTSQVVTGIRYQLMIEIAPALTCLNEDNTTSTIDQCPVDNNSISEWVVVVLASPIPVMYTVESAVRIPIVGAPMIIQNFSDPAVIGAACVAVNQITNMSNSEYRSALVSIENGTMQIVAGTRYELLIVVALSTTCPRNSTMCSSEQCPINVCTQYLWMASVILTPFFGFNFTPIYDVLNVTRIMPYGQQGCGGTGMMMPIGNLQDPEVVAAACAAVDEITSMSNSMYKTVLVTITSGTSQVVNGIRYELRITVAESTTCLRNSPLCTSMECPIGDNPQMQWMVSVVAPPTPINETINYDVLSVTPVSGAVVVTMSHWLLAVATLVACFISFSA